MGDVRNPQPSKDQVLRALRRNGVIVEDVPAWRLDDGGYLEVQLDQGGGVVLLQGQWSPGRDCFGGAECVGRTSCPRERACTE